MNAQDDDGNTALIIAINRAFFDTNNQQNHTEVVRILLKHGADPTLRNNDRKNAIDVATKKLKHYRDEATNQGKRISIY